jgi:hypothetical protein
MSENDTADLVTAIVTEYSRACRDREDLCLVPKVAVAEIRAAFVVLRAIQGDEPAFGFPADTKRYAEELQKWVRQGEALFGRMPKSFLRQVFYGANPFEASSRLNRFVTALGWFGERCGVILSAEAHGNRNIDFDKRQAAMAARYFTERCGLDLAYSTESGAYRVAAPLFYEAMTMAGWRAPSLKQQCEDVARLSDAIWNHWQTKFGAIIDKVLRRPQLQMNDKGGAPEAPFIGDTPVSSTPFE